VTRKQNSIEIGTLAGDFTLPGLTFQDPRGSNPVGLQEHLVQGDSWSIDAHIFGPRSSKVGSGSSRSETSSPAALEGSSELIYGTYFGSTTWDEGDSIDLDDDGNAYVTGYTQAITFTAKTGPLYANHGIDVFVLKLNGTGSELEYFLWFFTDALNAEDYGNDITVDDQGYAYVTGWTTSIDFETTPGAFDDEFNGGTWDVFVVKVNVDGDALEYSSYLGGTKEDRGLAIVADTSGAVFITGMTRSSDFPTSPGAFDEVIGDSDCGPEICSDGYVSKLDASGQDLTYSTYLGGDLEDWAYSLDLDGLGRVFVTGKTLSASTFPTTTNAYDGSHNGGNNAFLSTIGPFGSSLQYSTFLGGVDNDTGYGIKLSHRETAYLTGRTNSADFPTTPGSFDQIHNGDYDVFVSGLVAPISSRSFLPRLSNQ
jgi:hypothetical protein